MSSPLNQQLSRQLQERVTSMAPSDVLDEAIRFFSRQSGVYAAFPEKRGPTHVMLRGQGGEEIAIAAWKIDAGTMVSGSSYLLDQQVVRFLDALPSDNGGDVVSVPFVTSLGVRAETVRLVDGSNPRDAVLTLRVHGAEVWDAVRVEANASTPVRHVKQAALAVIMPDVDAIDNFVVKLGGTEIRNENLSLADSGVKNGATLLVMSRRRRAVR